MKALLFGAFLLSHIASFAAQPDLKCVKANKDNIIDSVELEFIRVTDDSVNRDGAELKLSLTMDSAQKVFTISHPNRYEYFADLNDKSLDLYPSENLKITLRGSSLKMNNGDVFTCL